MNKVILIGNLGHDPELRSTASGQSVATFSLATNRRWTDRQGQKQEDTQWSRCVAFGKTADVAGKYLGKGSRVAVEGRLQTRSWDDRGEKKFITEVVVAWLEMLGGGRQGGGGQDRSRGRDHDYGEDRGPDRLEDYGPPDDDIPF